MIKLLLLFLTVVGTIDCQENCRNGFKSMIECVSQRHVESQELDKQKMKAILADLVQCYTERNCSAPDFSSVNNRPVGGGAPAPPPPPMIQNFPESVRKCLIESAARQHLADTNSCLLSKHVAPLPFGGNNSDHAFDETFGKNDIMAGAAAYLGIIASSLQKCYKDQGLTAVGKVGSCLEGLAKGVRIQICGRVQKCIDENMGIACQRRGRDIREALCQCRKDKLTNVLTQLEKIQPGTPINPALFFDQEFKKNAERVRRCFTESGIKDLPPSPVSAQLSVPVVQGNPASLLPQATFSNPNFAATPVTLTPEMLNAIKQHLQARLSDQHCGCN